MIILSWMSPDYSRTFCSIKAGCNFNLCVCFETLCYKVTWQFSVVCLQLVDPLHRYPFYLSSKYKYSVDTPGGYCCSIHLQYSLKYPNQNCSTQCKYLVDIPYSSFCIFKCHFHSASTESVSLTTTR